MPVSVLIINVQLENDSVVFFLYTRQKKGIELHNDNINAKNDVSTYPQSEFIHSLSQII
jgi:hypothetical protein